MIRAALRRVGRRGRWLCWIFASYAASVPAATLEGGALLDALRGGGFHLYFRHAATDWSQQDRSARAGDWASCDPARMRQLSDAGRATALAVGAAIRRLQVPVGQVLASPYCRTQETARLLGLGPVVTTEAVINLRIADRFGGREAVIAAARRLLAETPPRGTNTIVVAHGNVAREATPVYPDEIEAVVFAATGDGGFRYVGRLRPDDWLRLAQGVAD